MDHRHELESWAARQQVIITRAAWIIGLFWLAFCIGFGVSHAG